MNQKPIVALALSSLLFFSQPVFAKDACKSLLCLAGAAMGQGGGSACNGAIKDYFSILRFGRKGRFDAGATASARGNYINQCSAGDAGSKSLVAGRYGRQYSF